jgi:hypothetical protein
VANRTQIVCLHEGKKGRSIDPLFIRTLIKKLDPSWIRPWPGNNVIRTVDCGGRRTLMEKLPTEIRAAEQAGGNTTVLVWADMDHDMIDGEALKIEFWKQAQQHGITECQFDKIIFVFAKDRLENWIEFLNTGVTDESREGPRVKDNEAVRAARTLADICLSGKTVPNIPVSLNWSCKNWRALKSEMS